MKTATIAFIGGGNMTRSIVSGLIKEGYNPNAIWVADRNPPKLEAFASQFQINTTENASEALEHGEIIVLAVKPQSMSDLGRQIGRDVAKKKPLVISVAAGVKLADLAAWFGYETPMVRAMPNTPSVIQCGATGLIANEFLASAQKSAVERVMRSVGITVWLEEEQHIDAVAALSGSGPAYFFLFMELMRDVGVSMGLTDEQAHLLTVQTAYGASRIALESKESLSTLRQHVTSKKGTTEAAINVFESHGLGDMVRQAMLANVKRSQALAKEFGASKQLADNS